MRGDELQVPDRQRRVFASGSGTLTRRCGLLGSENSPEDSATIYVPDASMIPSSMTTAATIFCSPIHQLNSFDFHQKFH